MYKLYEKVPKTDEYEYGMKLLGENINPFKEGPCLLSMIALTFWEKDVNGALNHGMEALRLKTNHNENAGIGLEEFNGRILSLAYGKTSEKVSAKGRKIIDGVSRKDSLDDEFTQNYLFPLIEEDGKKIDIMQAMKNMRNVNIITYCAATQSALRMEECLINRMNELGYSKQEISQIQSQMCIIGYATDVKMKTEFNDKKKIQSTCLSFGDVNDGDVSAPQGIKDKAKEKNTVYYNEGYYFHYGDGEHSLKNYILGNNAISVGISSVLTKAVSNSISNFNANEFKPLTKELLTEDIQKIIEGLRQGKEREELLQLVDKGIYYRNSERNDIETKQFTEQEIRKGTSLISIEQRDKAQKRQQLDKQKIQENQKNFDELE